MTPADERKRLEELRAAFDSIFGALNREKCRCDVSEWPYACDRCADLNRLRPVKSRVLALRDSDGEG